MKVFLEMLKCTRSTSKEVKTTLHFVAAMQASINYWYFSSILRDSKKQTDLIWVMVCVLFFQWRKFKKGWKKNWSVSSLKPEKCNCSIFFIPRNLT